MFIDPLKTIWGGPIGRRHSTAKSTTRRNSTICNPLDYIAIINYAIKNFLVGNNGICRIAPATKAIKNTIFWLLNVILYKVVCGYV